MRFSVKIMNSKSEPDSTVARTPFGFARHFLETRGAILEKTAGGFQAVLPDELAHTLAVSDLIRIQIDSAIDADTETKKAAAGESSFAIHYGAPLLDRMLAEATGEVPVLTWQLHFDYIKTQGFNRLIKEQFSFPNAVGSVASRAVVRTAYLLIVCHYTIQSDEQKEGLIQLVFNLETGACVPDMADLIDGLNRSLDNGKTGGAHNSADIQSLLHRAGGILKSRIIADTADFQKSMKRRFRRDVNNLTQYYNSLKKDMKNSLKRPGLSDQLIQDRREKIRLIPEELMRKKDDLLKKYSIHIKVQPCTMMHLKTDAVKLLFKASAGKNERTVPMIYNPVTKAVDPQVCQGCGGSTYQCAFCDQMHLLCPECRRECPVCK